MSKETFHVPTKVITEVTAEVTTEVTTNYIDGEDITIVWQLLYLGNVCIQRTLVGWYHGDPDDETTKQFCHLGVMAQYLWD